MPGRPTNLDNGRQGPTVPAVEAVGGCLAIFLSLIWSPGSSVGLALAY